MKYYIMHLPAGKNSEIAYLAYLGCDFGAGYTWTHDKNLAHHYSLRDAIDIKENFCAFGDSRENLVIACVDGIKGRWKNNYAQK